MSASLGPDPTPTRAAKPETQLTVSIIRPAVSSYRLDLTLTGTVEARTVTNIIPQVSGKIIQVSSKFRPGATVSKGDLLFSIEPSDYELDRQRTLADIEIGGGPLLWYF